MEEFYNVFKHITKGTHLILQPTKMPIGVFRLAYRFQLDSTKAGGAKNGLTGLHKHGDMIKDAAPTAAEQAEVLETPDGSVDFPDDVYDFNSTRSRRSRRKHY